MTDHISQSSPLLGTMTGQITGRIISNFALQHMIAAITFRNTVIELEEKYKGESFSSFFQAIRSYSSACLMSTAASLEALINELFIAHHGRLRSLIDNFEEQFWRRNTGIERKPILEKYQLALEIFGIQKLDEKSLEYRDAWAIIELRNALVHFKPTWDPERNRIVDLRELLEGRFETSPFMDEGADFVSLKCMSAGCVRWAVAAALAFLREFDKRASLEPKKMAAFWALET